MTIEGRKFYPITVVQAYLGFSRDRVLDLADRGLLEKSVTEGADQREFVRISAESIAFFVAHRLRPEKRDLLPPLSRLDTMNDAGRYLRASTWEEEYLAPPDLVTASVSPLMSPTPSLDVAIEHGGILYRGAIAAVGYLDEADPGVEDSVIAGPVVRDNLP